MNGQYKPAAIGNRKPYVKPGRAGCGIANCAIKPAAAMEKPAMMNGDRCWTFSDQKAKMRTMTVSSRLAFAPNRASRIDRSFGETAVVRLKG